MRHEREAHGMHGYGEKQFLCSSEGCDRAVAGNGFPRQWNLKDHMVRVHGRSREAIRTFNPAPVPTPTAKYEVNKRKRSQDERSSRKGSLKKTKIDNPLGKPSVSFAIPSEGESVLDKRRRSDASNEVASQPPGVSQPAADLKAPRTTSPSEIKTEICPKKS